ncbi:MAG TPA: hypothetical protein VF266_09020 [Thermoanaerobaculia bacterium]
MPCRIALSLLLSIAALSAQTPKQPWALTLEERIALRTHPQLARERSRGGGRVTTTAREGASPVVDAFDGKTHPELFLPHQVYRTLMEHAFIAPESSASVFRRGVAPDLSLYRLPPDFWERLRIVSADYIRDTGAINAMMVSLRQVHGRARSDALNALALKQIESCRSRAEALAAARREFGSEPFDRFLYEVIAVNMFHVTEELPRAEDLRKAEGGCR